MRGLYRGGAALSGAVLLLSALVQSASAQSPVESAISALVSSIDASSDWKAGYTGLTYDAGTDTATISGLNIGLENGQFKVGFDTIKVGGYADTPDGSFTAKSITGETGSVDAGIVKFSVNGVRLDGLAVPRIDPIFFNPGKPFTSLIRTYAQVLKAKLAKAHIDDFALSEEIDTVTTRISYEGLDLTNFADGKISEIHAGPLKVESPSPEGLVNVTIASVESKDTDIGALLRAYDPDQYNGAPGDMVWHTALASSAYRDIVVDLPGAKVSIGEVSLDGFKARQPKVPLADFFNAVMSQPNMPKDQIDQLALQHIPGLLSAFGIGKFSLGPVKVAAAGIDSLELGNFHLNDFSSDGLGEFAVEGLDGAIEGQGSLKLGRFAFGGLVFPAWELVVAAVGQNGPPDDILPLLPKLGFVDFAGFTVETPDVPRLSLEKLRVDLKDYIGPVPTSAAMDVAGLDLPLDYISDPEAREAFKRLGYDRVNADYRLRAAWDEKNESIKVDELHFGFKDAGALTSNFVLSGLPRSAIEHPETMEQVAPNLSLDKATLTFMNQGIVAKGLAILAEKMHVPPEKFQQQFADALPFLLSIFAVNNPTLLAIVKQSGLLTKATPAIKAFVAEPAGSITITLNPPSPVALPAIADAAQNAPDKLVGMLGLDISGGGSASPAPANPSPSPGEKSRDLRPTIQPGKSGQTGIPKP